MNDFISETDRELHRFSELRDTGLLWLVNRVVFHPRGFALGLDLDDESNATGWKLLGDGSEVWAFTGGNEDAKFDAVQQFLRQHTRPEAR